MAASGGGRTKFIIPPFRQSQAMDEEYANRTWQTLHNAIQEIHRQNASGLSFEELYRNAYNMVLHKFGDKLYNGLVETITLHLRGVAAEVQSASDGDFLAQLRKMWEKHRLSSIMIRDILMYMDRTYVSAQKKVPVFERGLEVFRDEVVRHPRIKDRLLHTLLDLIQRERCNETIERGLIKAATSMLLELGHDVYQRDFEAPMLAATAEFYKKESNEYISQTSASEYMRKAEQRLAEEAERVHHYLDRSSEPRLKEVVERELLAVHMHTLAEMPRSGVVPLMEDDRFDDLRRAYELFRRVKTPEDGLGVIRDIMCSYVKGRGQQLVSEGKESRDPIDFVKGLLAMRDKYAKIIEASFHADKGFFNALNATFENFVNLDSHSPEYLSLFVDELMRKGMRGTSEDEIEVTLDKVVMLFRYLQEKDVFERYYKNHLAKRLLGGRSVSDDVERSMIAKLKVECGYQFTSKLEGMFTDMRVSADMQENFRAARGGSSKVEGIELSVQVLTTGFWPQQITAGCNLPSNLARCCEEFRAHYLKRHSGRRLQWHTAMGTAEMKARFRAARHDISVSTYMMCVLLLFNDAHTLSYADIARDTSIAPAELKRTLQSLACGRFKLLTKEPKGREVEESDTFSFNEGFTCKQLRFKVATVAAQKETESEKLETRAKVEDDRKPQIEAAIVRIMKARKDMEHNALIADVTAQLSSRFMPHPNVIKKRIESLIEREFLERNKSNWRMYKYLA